MIPNNENYDEETDEELAFDFELGTESSLTYAMNMERNTFVGKVNDIEAIRQAVIKIIHTERYEHEIYSWDYGIELKNLIGKSMPFVMSEIKQRITDALLADERIESVDDFTVTKKDKRTLHCTFKVTTIQGDEFETESEVEI